MRIGWDLASDGVVGWVGGGRVRGEGPNVFVLWAESGEGALRDGGRWLWVGDGGVGGQMGGWCAGGDRVA